MPNDCNVFGDISEVAKYTATCGGCGCKVELREKSLPHNWFKIYVVRGFDVNLTSGRSTGPDATGYFCSPGCVVRWFSGRY